MSALTQSIAHRNVVPGKNNVKESLIHRLNRWYINYRTRRQLARLPDAMLKDIGVSRSDAEQEADKVFWKD